MSTVMSAPETVGELLRGWRQRRHRSQLDLASAAEVSPRHLSFVETGRSRPSREMVLHLAEHLEVPLRDRNALLVTAGYAPAYGTSDLDDPAMAAVRHALELICESHDPYPAIVLDRHWNVVMTNSGADGFLALVPAELHEPVPNIMRITLHPDGLRDRIVNITEVEEHLLARLRRQLTVTGDSGVRDLLDELAPFQVSDSGAPWTAEVDVVLPVTFDLGDGHASFFSTLTTFGSPLDVTVSELVVELFFPA